MDLRNWMRALWAVAAALNAVALYMVFFYAPTEFQMGAVQKIFYYHVPSAIAGYVLMFLAFVFITIVLVTGPIWGRSAWGKWWVWEPRLTSALILWLMYSAYLLLRLFSRHEVRTARVAAVVAIIAFFDVPIVHMAIKWWGSVVHPVKVVLEPPMRLTWFVSMAAVFVLAAALALTRWVVGREEERRMASEVSP